MAGWGGIVLSFVGVFVGRVVCVMVGAYVVGDNVGTFVCG